MAPLLARRAIVPALALLATSLPAWGKAPAYRFADLAFTTSLHNVDGGGRKEPCFDQACRQPGGLVVAEGQTEGGPSAVRIVVREHRERHGATRDDLLRLSKQLASRAPKGRQVRVVSGSVAGHAALEQWTSAGACDREVRGRVLLAMPDKVIELEASATLQGEEDAATALAKMNEILHALRVRRVGDASIDPATVGMSLEDVGWKKPGERC